MLTLTQCWANVRESCMVIETSITGDEADTGTKVYNLTDRRATPSTILKYSDVSITGDFNGSNSTNTSS